MLVLFWLTKCQESYWLGGKGPLASLEEKDGPVCKRTAKRFSF